MNSDASAELKLLAQFSSASFTLCIVATLRKALAIIGGDDKGLFKSFCQYLS
jgi:hypothetical protein